MTFFCVSNNLCSIQHDYGIFGFFNEAIFVVVLLVQDENIASDDDDIEGEDEENNRSENSSHLGDEVEEEDDGRHMRMLQGITGMPSEAFEGKIEI